MAHKLVDALKEHAEDVAIAVGIACVTAGVAWKCGGWAGLVTFGVLALAYGVLIL